MSVKIFVCYHKKDEYQAVDGYVPIHVGKANSTLDLGFIGDDSGENISALNPWYCELTALYWAWKNELDADYIGLTHYRRTFDFSARGRNRWRRAINCDEKYFFKHEKLDEKFISQYDAVVPKIAHDSLPIRVNLSKNHIKQDVHLLRDVVAELYPDYLETYDKVMNGNIYTPCNMMIAKRQVFQEYCSWLFGILFHFSSKLSIPYNPYQPRVFGFYSERLLYVFLLKNKYNVGFAPMTIMNNQKNPSIVLQCARSVLSDFCCFLYKKIGYLL